jgi:hypothetical protein
VVSKKANLFVDMIWYHHRQIKYQHPRGGISTAVSVIRIDQNDVLSIRLVVTMYGYLNWMYGRVRYVTFIPLIVLEIFHDLIKYHKIVVCIFIMYVLVPFMNQCHATSPHHHVGTVEVNVVKRGP